MFRPFAIIGFALTFLILTGVGCVVAGLVLAVERTLTKL